MQAIPILVKDVRTFHQKVDDGMTAHVERLNEFCRLTLWLKTNVEQMATLIANLEAEVALLKGMCGATRSYQKEEDWQLGLQEKEFSDDEMAGAAQDRGEITTDPTDTDHEDDDQFGCLQEIEVLPYQEAYAQEGGMRADPVQAQGINAGDEAAQGESDREFDTKQEQLLA